MKTNHVLWDTLVSLNHELEEKLTTVKRWSRYIEFEEDGSQCRVQRVAQHLLTAILNADIFLELILPYFKRNTLCQFDRELFLRAVQVHDYGEIIHALEEGGNGEDVLYQSKNASGDYREYCRFMELIKPFRDTYPGIWTKYRNAFLLQFTAEEKQAGFPEDERAILSWFSLHFFLEVKAFEGLERWGYVLFALEQFQNEDLCNERILTEVLDGQGAHLDLIADVLPGFREEIWTDEIRERAGSFLMNHLYIENPHMEGKLLWRDRLLEQA